MAFLPTVLPRLQGGWLLACRVLFCAAFLVTLLSAIGATWLDARPADEGAPGWRTFLERETAYGVRIFPPGGTSKGTWGVAKVFSADALASGLHDGDQVLAMNGRIVTSTTTISDMALSLSDREGARLTLRTRAADGAVSDHTLLYRTANIDAWYRGSGLTPWRQYMLRRIAYDLMTVLLLAVSTILFLRRSHEIVTAAFAFGLCLLPVGPAIEAWASANALQAYQIVSALPYIPILMVGAAFPDGRFWPAWTRYSLIVVPLILLPAMFRAIEYSQFTLFAAPFFLAIVVILALRYRRLTQGVERQQLRWAAFGLIAGILLLVGRFPFALLQAGSNPGPLAAWIDLTGSFLHALGYAVIGAGLGVALLKHRLYDAESFIGRSTAIAAATLLLAGLWATTEKALELLLPDLVGPQFASLANVMSAGVAVIAVTSMHTRVEKWIEKRFQKGVYRLKAELPATLQALTIRLGVSGLCAKVLDDITRDVRAAKAAILVRNSATLSIAGQTGAEAADLQPWLSGGSGDHGEDDPFPVALPLVDPIMREDIGWLLIGPRPDGSSCNRDEREALASVAPLIACAIANVRARDLRETKR